MKLARWMAISAALLIAAAVGAQERSVEPRPQCDAASVKLQRDPTLTFHYSMTPAGIRATKMAIKTLIAMVYGVRPERIIGGPDWLDVNEYDIVARTNQAALKIPAVKEMIKSLLADRFHLRVHTESRDEPVYALVVARQDRRLGRSLRPSVDCASDTRTTSDPAIGGLAQRRCGIRILADRRITTIEAGSVALSELVRSLDGTGGRRVIDKTGLTGLFDFDLRFAPPPPPGTQVEPGDVPEVFTALREQLGLALDTQPGQVEVMVIDEIQRATEN